MQRRLTPRRYGSKFSGVGIMQRLVMEVCQLVPPFYTPKAILWNIKTLGFACWAQCLAQNACFVIARQGRPRLF